MTAAHNPDPLLAFAGAILVCEDDIDPLGELTDENGGTLIDAAIIGGLIGPPDTISRLGRDALAAYYARMLAKVRARGEAARVRPPT